MSVTKGNDTSGKLLVVFELFSSFAQLDGEGQLSRMLHEYDRYSGCFEKVYIKTLDKKKCFKLRPNIEHLPFPAFPFRKYSYVLFSCLSKYKHVDYIEIDDTRAIFSVLVYKIVKTRIFLHHKWSSSKLLKDRPLIALFTRLGEIIAFILADTVAVTTKKVGDDVRMFTNNNKIYLLPNYVDIECFKRIETQKIKNLIVFVGRLHPEKNIPMLLNVMKELPDFKLWVIGDGELKLDLFSMKMAEKIENVEFLGTIPNEELPKYFNMAEAFIITSYLEGHPKALIEAMSCGLPSIGTDVDGIRDVIIDGETGFLCKIDTADIKRCILKLFGDREKMDVMGRNAREFAVNNYSMEILLDRKTNLIKGYFTDIEPLYGE
jgi:glycosyltransferase involved in cell wall biosynthesis